MPDPTSAAPAAAPATVLPVKPPHHLAPPSSWAKAKGTPAWLLAGAYAQARWTRDPAGHDLSDCTEVDFDATCAAVASISLSASPPVRTR